MSHVDHYIVRKGEMPPPVDETRLHDYALASDGLYVRGRRPGLEVCFPVARARVRGLGRLIPYVVSGFPRMPARFLARSLDIGRARCDDRPTEALFHFSFDERGEFVHSRHGSKVLDFSEGWHFEYPEQFATGDSVRPVHNGPGSSVARAVVELHTHPYDAAVFSPTDDKDEGGFSFRLCAVMGRIFDRPQIRLRVALFGHFHDCPVSEFFELPAGLADCVKS